MPKLKLFQGGLSNPFRKGGDMETLANSNLARDMVVDVRPDMAEMIARFVRYAQVKSSSAATYLRALRIFATWLNRRDIAFSNVHREDIIDFLQELKDREISPLTINCYLTAVKRFFEYAEEATSGKVRNVANKIKGPKRQNSFCKGSLTPDQVHSLLKVIEEEGKGMGGLRDYALVNLIVCTGLRAIEVSRADIGDLTAEAGKPILLIHGKGRELKDDFVPLFPEAEKPIREYLAARGKAKTSEPLFVSGANRNNGERLTTHSISRLVAFWLQRAGLKSDRITCHSLRHSTAMLALAGGAPVEKIQDLLRHASINTTMIYLRNRNRLEDGAENFLREVLYPDATG